MDIRMPGMDGLTATARLPPRREPPRVLVLTTFHQDAYVYEALRAGASGFLLKDAEPADLLAAIRVVAAGEAMLSPAVTRRLIDAFAAGAVAAARPADPRLTADARANARCWCASPRACPTPRSARRSASPPAR